MKDTKKHCWENTQMILGLIGKKLPKLVYKKWTVEQVDAAIDYAGAAHFRASDNHNKVPPMPKHVKELKDLRAGLFI